MRFRALVAMLMLVTAPLHAAITDIALTGRGRVTYSTPGDIYGTPVFGPAIGTPVNVSLAIRIGGLDPDTELPTAPPDDFTGRFTFNFYLLQSGEQSFAWGVAGGNSGGNTGLSNAYQEGWLDFVDGQLIDFTIYTDSDPETNTLTPGGWSYAAGEGGWGGTWAAVPEPASWALLIAGFALTGAALRGRRAAGA